jgi:peptidyl-prolyl cis-trans isomerase SurA
VIKKAILILSIALGNSVVYSQTFISYGSNTISKQEFQKAYNKNKTTVSDKEKSLREYVDLYTNFKLKVKAAEELKLDTLPQIQTDIKNFRDQIMDNYLSDEKGIQRLTNEAFERVQKDLHVIHYFAAVPVDASVADTAKAYAAVMSFYAAPKSANASQAGELTNAVKQTDLGFISAFSVSYPYENIIYALKKEELSKPFRSKSGWHMFRVTEERLSVGRWRIAQVLIALSPDADDSARIVAQKKADVVYGLLKSGDNFGATAKMYSDDKISYLNGGELPEFGTGVYSSSFENEVFKLKADGDISMPFLTPFGYHIIKRMGFSPTPADQTDDAFMFDIKQKVMKDTRVNSEKEKYIRDIIAKVGVLKLTPVKDADLYRFADSLMTNPTEEQTKAFPISGKKLLRIKEETLVGSDWLSFVRDYKSNYTAYKGETGKQLWDKFLESSALNYYKKHLEEYNSDFKFQMQEFKEGNMLFEIMERNVWGKAISDSAGLLTYYNAHKTNFKWAESADVLIFNCTTSKAAEEAIIALKKGKNWRSIADDPAANNSVQADSGRYEITQIIGANYATPPTKGNFTAIVTNIDGSATFVKYVNLYEANQQRSFEEARGLVINEYQLVLEQQWIEALKKKYPVKVNEAMLKEML